MGKGGEETSSATREVITVGLDTLKIIGSSNLIISRTARFARPTRISAVATVLLITKTFTNIMMMMLK